MILLYCTDGKIAHLPRVHATARLCRCVNQVDGESSTMVVTERERNEQKERKKKAHSSNSQHWSLRTKRRRETLQEVGGWVTSSSSHYVTLGLERLTIATSAYGYSSSVKLD